MAFAQSINKYGDMLNTELNKAITAENPNYEILARAMKYSAIDGGKRIRPILLMEFYKLCGGTDNAAIKFATALEMIHTYSLIHDDLPCMDNDDFRRGKISCHKKFSEGMAVLAGDALLTSAFEYASQTDKIPSERVIKAINILARCSGINGMVGGQVIDTLGVDLDNEKALIEMYALKTGALLNAACSIGCILAGRDEKLPYAQRFASCIGIAFQIIDDILDVSGTEAELGKPIGSDEKNSKTTFVTIYGVEKAKEIADNLTSEAKGCIDNFDGDGIYLKELTDFLLNRKY